MKNAFSVASRCVVIVLLCAVQGSAANLVVTRTASRTELALQGQQPFHGTEADVTDARVIDLPNSTLLIALWSETRPSGTPVPHYAFSFDGSSFSRVGPTSYQIKLHYARFDPLQSVPQVPAALRADPSSGLFIVQFVMQPLRQLRETLRGLGATVHNFLTE